METPAAPANPTPPGELSSAETVALTRLLLVARSASAAIARLLMREECAREKELEALVAERPAIGEALERLYTLHQVALEEAPAPADGLPLRNDGLDVLVNFGDLSRADLSKVKLDGEYEAMVEDCLGCLNNMLVQGVRAEQALFALCQACAIALGCALRAQLPWSVAQQLVGMIVKNASTSEKMLRLATSGPQSS